MLTARGAGTRSETDTNGCTTKSLPLGTPVKFAEGGNVLFPGTTVGTGTLAYSSWLTMQAAGEKDPSTCAYNDLALVKVAKADSNKVSPSVPFFGGPVAPVDTNGTAPGNRVYSFGNSSLRAGIGLLSPKVGRSLGDDHINGGWTHPVCTLTPGIPGDSGSGFVDATGHALGVLSTLALAPRPSANGVGDLNKELAYAQAQSGIAGLALVPGTQPFAPIW